MGDLRKWVAHLFMSTTLMANITRPLPESVTEFLKQTADALRLIDETTMVDDSESSVVCASCISALTNEIEGLVEDFGYVRNG